MTFMGLLSLICKYEFFVWARLVALGLFFKVQAGFVLLVAGIVEQRLCPLHCDVRSYKLLICSACLDLLLQ